MKPKEDPDIKLRDHVYDGIQEYDQRLPNWWLWTFYGAIIFSVLYWFYLVQTAPADRDDQRVEAELERIRTAQLESMQEINASALWQMADNQSFVEQGREVYAAQCQACHLESLRGVDEPGGIGFNLVDDEWVHADSAMGVYNTVVNGVPEKGMPSWQTVLGPEAIARVTAYVLSQNSREEFPKDTLADGTM